MKKLLTVAAIMAFFSGSAFADNYDNTNYTIAAEGEKFGLSVGTGDSKDFADNANVIDLHTNALPVNVGVKMIDDNTNQDWRFYAFKKFQSDLSTSVGIYATPSVNYTKGDSYSKDELRISPVIGANYKGITGVTPFAQFGYDWKSTEGDFTNFSASDSIATVGGVFAVTEASDLTVAFNHEMDKDFNNTDKEVAVKFTVKF